MKEVTRNTVSPRYIPFVFVFDIPETKNTKGKDNVKVTIYISPYDEYGKGPDTQYMETVAELLAEADWQNISIDEYSKELENGDYVSIPDEDWEYNIDYRGVKRTTFAEKIDVLLKDEAIPNEDKKKLSLLKELSPREILRNTKTIQNKLEADKKEWFPTFYQSSDKQEPEKEEITKLTEKEKQLLSSAIEYLCLTGFCDFGGEEGYEELSEEEFEKRSAKKLKIIHDKILGKDYSYNGSKKEENAG